MKKGTKIVLGVTGVAMGVSVIGSKVIQDKMIKSTCEITGVKESEYLRTVNEATKEVAKCMELNRFNRAMTERNCKKIDKRIAKLEKKGR